MLGMTSAPILHGYFRSSASYRVRIALGLKGVAWRDAFHHVLRKEHKTAAYLALNPQGLIPALEVGGAVLTQSLAICEYLDEAYPDPPLLPANPLARAQVRAVALAIACEIHPLQNIGVLDRLRGLGVVEDQVHGWARDTIDQGFAAIAGMLAGQDGPFCFGSAVTLADVCLIPQLANARRFGARTDYARFEAIEAACLALPAFARADPAVQGDAR
jgi:maleylpyruvate isomerase